MTGIAQGDWVDQADEAPIQLDSRIDPSREEAYWQSVYWAEPYYRGERDYEDYAPAYCVGYVGYAQYGGSFADADKSLCANWFRIKGASRLELDEAMWAMRAAWLHAEQVAQRSAEAAIEEDEDVVVVLPLPQRARAVRQPALATA